MRSFDFSSWQAVLSTVLGLGVVTLVMLGVRLLVMQTIQRRRERENRQINERLRTLIAAYKTLGGSFTGDLAVDPRHLREFAQAEPDTITPSERRRRIRDAVEAALSDIILLGTSEQVGLAVAAANDLVAGRPVQTRQLVVALRNFIREALDLEPLMQLDIPPQGPTRPSGTQQGRGKGRGRPDEAAAGAGGGGRVGGGGTGGGAAGAGGMGAAGLAVGLGADDAPR
jgi:heme exporter protein D